MEKKKIYLFVILGLMLCLYQSCNPDRTNQKPNILWIVLEDTSPYLGCYGSDLVPTPNIDALADRGIVFRNAFMSAPVCSASRSAMITGIMATTLGLHNHHSSRTEESAIYLPDSIQTIPEIFKDAGYFTFNNGKDDYNFSYDRMDLYSQTYSWHPLYGKSGKHVPFDSLLNRQPFFGQIQLYGGKEIFSSKFKERVKNPVNRDKITLPPYLPDHPVIIEEFANHLDAIQITDERVGKIIAELDEKQLLENTIVFFFSDHGQRLTRHKQFLYEGGIHVPMITTDFRKTNEQTKRSYNSDLISGIDLGPTSLALAGIEIPEYMEGIDVFGSDKREYVISARDRCDFTIDRIRSVRIHRYKYIRNFMTNLPYSQSTYMDLDGVPFVKTMKELHKNGKLDSIQDHFYTDNRPAEELYDLKNDPYEINNLASNPDYQDKLKELSGILKQWIIKTDDAGQYPEREEGLKLMLGIWGKHATNPEYDALREKYPDLEGSQWGLKSSGWKTVELK